MDSTVSEVAFQPLFPEPGVSTRVYLEIEGVGSLRGRVPMAQKDRSLGAICPIIRHMVDSGYLESAVA